MISKKTIIDNIKTLLYALFIAVVIRSLIIQPFYIPSSSMELNLLVGDRLFVTNILIVAVFHFHLLPIFSGRI